MSNKPSTVPLPSGVHTTKYHHHQSSTERDIVHSAYSLLPRAAKGWVSQARTHVLKYHTDIRKHTYVRTLFAFLLRVPHSHRWYLIRFLAGNMPLDCDPALSYFCNSLTDMRIEGGEL